MKQMQSAPVPSGLVRIVGTFVGAVVLSLACQGCRREAPPMESGSIPGDSAAAKTRVPSAEVGDSSGVRSAAEVVETSSFDSLFVPGEIVDSSQVQVVSGRCAVSVTPSDSVLEAYQKEAGEENWNEVVADNEYYTSMVTDTLEAHGVRVEFTSRDRRYLRFEAANGKRFLVDLAKGKDLWGLILFDGKKKPDLWHSTELSPEWKRRMLEPM